jgi:hypothetical protein
MVMSLSDFASIGNIVSGLAVLASLIYLALQVRQSDRNQRALIQQGRASRIADTSLKLAELGISREIEKCFDGDQDITASDLQRFLFICRSTFVSAEDSYLQNRAGLFDGLAFQAFESGLKSYIGMPGILAGWKMTRQAYEPEFRGYMDRIAATALPLTKSNRLIQWQSVVSEITGT